MRTLLACLLVAGCGDDSVLGPDDGGFDAAATLVTDAAASRDLSVAVDLARPADLASAPDLSPSFGCFEPPADGGCGAPRVLACGPRPNALAADDDWVYELFAGSSSDELHAISAHDGSDRLLVAASSLGAPVVDGGFVYLPAGNSILRIASGTWTVEQIAFASSAVGGAGLALDSSRVYWSEPGAIHAVDKSGGTPTTPFSGADADLLSGLINDGAAFFAQRPTASQQQEIVSAPMTGGPLQSLAVLDANAHLIAVNPRRFFVHEGCPGCIIVGIDSISRADGSTAHLAAAAPSYSSLGPFLFDGALAYFHEWQDPIGPKQPSDTIFREQEDGTGAVVLANEYATEMAVSSSFLYYYGGELVSICR